MKLLDILTAPWAILPEKLREIRSVYETHLKGERIDIEGFEAKYDVQFQNGQVEGEGLYSVNDGVAIIPIEGVISKRFNFFSRFFGGTSTEIVGEAMKAAIEDPSVNSILLYVDSPGGSIDGTAELAELIYSLRGEKPINAFTDGMMASAAYWIASAADKIFISGDTACVGSIGVVYTHMDVSKLYEESGYKVTQIQAGRFKTVGSPYKPLSENDQSVIQAEIDYLYNNFVRTVAKHRGVNEDVTLKDMADGRIFTGEQAIKAGLVDGVSTFDALITDLTTDHDGAIGAGYKANTVTTKSEEENMDIKELKAKHPDIAEAIKAEGFEAGKVEGLTEGAAAECQRIKDIEGIAASMPGHDDIIAEMKADGKTTGPEAATRIVAAEGVKNKARADTIIADGKALAGAVPPAEGGSDGVVSGDPTTQFEAKVTEHVKAEGCKKSVATKAVMKAHPKLYENYIAAANKKGGK